MVLVINQLYLNTRCPYLLIHMASRIISAQEKSTGYWISAILANKSDISYLKTSRAFDVPIHSELSWQPFSVG